MISIHDSFALAVNGWYWWLVLVVDTGYWIVDTTPNVSVRSVFARLHEDAAWR